jgi:exodeoxyribonuclease-5
MGGASMNGDKRLGVKDLSVDQLKVYEQIVDWSNDPFGSDLLTVGGLGGTGKTTVLGVFASLTNLQVAYVAFTGRASSILARKLKASGADVDDKVFTDNEKVLFGQFGALFSTNHDASYCGTIHRLLYRPIINSKDELLGWTAREKLDRKYDLLVLDEASMIGDSLLEDLKKHGVRILAVGDHGQLPPVADTGSLMENPDCRLEKIHRQAAGNPIIQLAHRVRSEGFLDRKLEGKQIRFGAKEDAAGHLVNAYIGRDDPSVGGKINGQLDVGVMCWTNKSRIMLNGLARKARGMRGPPRKGEVLICLRNKPPIYNGMRGLLTADSVLVGGNTPWLLSASLAFPDEGIGPSSYTLCAPQFNREKTFAGVDELRDRGVNVDTMKEAGDLYDFGYAMTTHKAQGSSFEHAIIYLDRPEKPWDEEWRRWAYTSVTRASERLTVLT